MGLLFGVSFANQAVVIYRSLLPKEHIHSSIYTILDIAVLREGC
jgi:hypothetical protein